jgi:hypothetical protein
MTFRPWVTAALCLGTLAAWSPAAAPGPQKYRIDIKTRITQDLSAMGQGAQTQELSNSGYVTLLERDSAGARVVRVTLDSILAGPGSPVTPEQLNSVKGATWTGVRGPTGRVDSLALVNPNEVAGTLGGMLKTLFPPLRKGASAGQSWTDTTDAEGLLGVTARTVTNLVTAADSYEGATAMKLTGASATAISGTVQSPQGQLAIEGTGTGSVSWLIAGDGMLVSSNGTSNQKMTVTIAVAPAPIPVSVDITSTTTLLK